MPIQTTRLGDLNDLPEVGSLHRARGRAVHGQRTVTAPAVVVLEIVAEDPAQVPLAKDDDLGQALAPDAADHWLGEWILPGTARGD